MRKYTDPCLDCGGISTCRSLCANCYQRRRYHGLAMPPTQTTGGPCSVTGCSMPIKGHGYCRSHWDRWRKHGDPLAGARRPPRILSAVAGREWRAVVGFEGRYEVSSTGDVRSLPGTRGGGRVLTPFLSGDGDYYCVDLLGGSRTKRKTSRVHCLVLEAFVGPRPPGMYGCHNDGNSKNNTLLNLRWDTPGSNMLDRVAHGRDPNAVKTTCPRGHELREPNLALATLAGGRRGCLACHRASGLDRMRKRRGQTGIDVRAHADRIYLELLSGTSGIRATRGRDGRFQKADTARPVATGG